MILQYVALSLRNVIQSEGHTVGQAAELMCVSRPQLSNVLNGKSELSPQMAAKFAATYGIQTVHLLIAQVEKDYDMYERKEREQRR